MRTKIGALIALAGTLGCARGGDYAERPPQPAVEFMAPVDGATLTGPIEIALGIQAITLRPAGTMEPNTGHHHLFINRPIVAEGEVIPAEAGVVHLGAAQTAHTLVDLAPGEYTVIAVLGDHAHARIPGSRTDTVRFTVRAP